jgi:hypothetical protein
MQANLRGSRLPWNACCPALCLFDRCTHRELANRLCAQCIEWDPGEFVAHRLVAAANVVSTVAEHQGSGLKNALACGLLVCGTCESDTDCFLCRSFRMSDTKDKVKAGIDDAADKAKRATGKVVDKTKEAAHTAGEKVKEAGQYIEDKST